MHFQAGTALLCASQEKLGFNTLRSDPRGLELLAKGISQLRKCIAVVDARVAADTAFEMTGEEFAYVCEYEELTKNFVVLDIRIYLISAINLHSAAGMKLPEGTSRDGLLPTDAELLSVFQRGAALVERGESEGFRVRLPGGGHCKPPYIEGIVCRFLQSFEELISGLEPQPDGPLHADFHRRFDFFLLANQLRKTQVDAHEATVTEGFQAASAEDVSKSGLHPCAFPSCGCTEHSPASSAGACDAKR